jgi:RNA polymerase sigma factor (sigma-70 family)
MLDQQLLDQIRKGHSNKALATLYHHYPMIRKMIRTQGGGSLDAEDIFQEALLLLVRNVRQPGFTLTSKLSTYLYGIARYLWRDELRRRPHSISLELLHDPKDLEALHDSEDFGPLTQAVEKEQQARLAEKVLNELGERCRELLLLFYHGGLKLKDIASKMGYNSENTAKNQKYKCIEAAKIRLQELNQIHQTL